MFDLCGDDHGPCPCDKDHGADGHHGVDKVIAEHLYDRRDRIWRHHPDNGLKPVVPHEHGRGFPGSIHLCQGFLHHQIRCGEKMDHITQYKDAEGSLQAGPGEGKEERKAQDHSRYGIGHQGDPLNDILQDLIDLAPGCHQRASVSNERAEKRCKKRHV